MDSTNTTAIAKAMIPRLPMIFKTTVLNPLGYSPMASFWDLRTELTVNVVRSFLYNDKPIAVSSVQRLSKKGSPIKGKMHISQVAFPRPEDSDVLARMCEAIDATNQDNGSYTKPSLEAVEAEWTGYREGVDANAPRLDVSEKEHYSNIMKDTKSDITILYFHGGAYYAMDPSSHRLTVSRLAKLTGGRCLSVRYRLSPEYPFPAQLLDAFVSYLSLLYPPPGVCHEAVPPQKIAFAGDSAGGHLGLCLIQLILVLQRLDSSSTHATVRWYGKVVEVPLPSCVAPNSGWMDPSSSFPSMETNVKVDYLPPPSAYKSEFIECPIWPAEPPRHHFFAEDSMMYHPLICLPFADWKGAPPMWIDCGEELLADEIKYVAKSAAASSVKVKFEEYQAMPHCFALILEVLPATKLCFKNWTDFIKASIETPDDIPTGGTFYDAKTLKSRDLELATISEFTEVDVRQMVAEKLAKRKDITPPTRASHTALHGSKAKL